MSYMIRESQFWLRIVVAVFAVWIFISVHAVYWPVVVSLIVTFILIPVRDAVLKGVQRLTGRRIPVDAAILISFVVLILVLVGITNSILHPLVIQVNLLAANFQNLVDKTAALVMNFENSQTQLYIPDQVKSIINDSLVKIGNYGVDGVSNLVKSVFAIAGTVIEFFVVPIITFYFMKDGSRMVDHFVHLYPEEYRLQLDVLFDEVDRVLSSYIRGQLIMSCIISLLTFIGMWILGVPYPMVIALLAAITEWIPIIGPIVGAVPAILLGALVSPALAVKVLIFYIVIQQIDSHLIMPQVMGAVISLHPVAIVIALLMGGTLFGIQGMILTVPITAVLQIICKHLWFYNTYKTKAMNFYGKN
ncbi:Predicted PurR-regulated permease PerM [Megasphaera paucivorans]|uniref:Predicted PurR-regulated permease PerM n=2 Tax=Megasphaera paucivorans TaxID=349095 RepID=A0A1G9Q0A2_9FIRM|nr:Predicted PurR-regulated permease PerM [Megasphaera paucivorans]